MARIDRTDTARRALGIRPAAGGALALALALGLSGCFANPLDGLIEGGVEGVIEDQTGVDVDIDGSEGGSGASLPDTWPSDVPTANGEVQYSLAAEGAFTAGILVGSYAEAEAAVEDLADAGFTETAALDLGEGARSVTFENGTWNVTIVIAENEDGTGQMQYAITPATQ